MDATRVFPFDPLLGAGVRQVDGIEIAGLSASACRGPRPALNLGAAAANTVAGILNAGPAVTPAQQ
jgi:hypothetical protein